MPVVHLRVAGAGPAKSGAPFYLMSGTCRPLFPPRSPHSRVDVARRYCGSACRHVGIAGASPRRHIARMENPEILAPAGDRDTLRTALAAGADAVYFGLDDGFNARAKAESFGRDVLPEVVARCHRAGARAFVTLNTLVFQSELAIVEAILRDVAAAGVDAIIVQDPAICLHAGALCPDLELHASTQMTVSSPEAARFAQGLGAVRIVVPRELSVADIDRFARETELELEVFVHGALCMSWSGQCLTSAAWGGRSANRGQCAQSCRMPYDLVVDGETRDLGDVRYLLSPQDLAGVRAVPALVASGVRSFKIEGRYKGPAYVDTAVRGYRRWLDAVVRDGGPSDDDAARMRDDLRDMTLAFSRGFGDGFLSGSDHQTLVEGRFPAHRGLYLGRVIAVEGDAVIVARDPQGRPQTGGLALGPGRDEISGDVRAPLPRFGADADIEIRAGMGCVFDDGRPEEEETGGPIFAVDDRRGGWRLRFGRPGPELRRVTPGQRVWLNANPALARSAIRAMQREPDGRVPVRLVVSGRAGAPLRAEATGVGTVATASSDAPLAPARSGGLDPVLLRDKLGAFGGTPFSLAELDTGALEPGLHLPVSQLKAVRRRLVDTLGSTLDAGPKREITTDPVLPALLAAAEDHIAPSPEMTPALVPLCRLDSQLDAVIALARDGRVDEVELDWMEFVGLRRAVERARAAGLKVTIATVRVQKPGEAGYDRRIDQLEPDGVLLRHWGALMHFAEHPGPGRPKLHGDFSLNVTNSLTAAHLLGRGLDTVTAAHDLDADQVMGLLEHTAHGRVAIAVHHHIPTFHTEHCVYAHMLSRGRDWRSCGRPCDRHSVSLRDHTGHEHPVIVDVECRNTVFNAAAQSAASLVPRLVDAGVRRLRVEFVRETEDQARTVLGAWRALLDGELDAAALHRRVGVHEQFGVVRGTMRVLRD